jgi:hypothetical protein
VGGISRLDPAVRIVKGFKGIFYAPAEMERGGKRKRGGMRELPFMYSSFLI